MTKVKCNFKKLLGLAICLVLLIGTVYVPMSFSTNAAGNITTFTFDTFVDSTTNKNTAISTGAGYYGVGWQLGGDTNKYLQMLGIGVKDTNNGYNRKSGYRLENNGQLYYLEPSTTYYLTMKVQATKAPATNANVVADKPCVIKLGYNAYFNEKLSGNDTNYINTMTDTLCVVATGVTGSKECTFKSASGDFTVKYSETEWHEVSYVFTTPADMGSKDKALALWSESFSSFLISFDDITINKLGKGGGLVIINDQYSGKSEMIYGTVGNAVNLPDISDRAFEEEHEFLGWFTDEARTKKAENLVFTSGVQIVYSSWDAPVTYIFKDNLNNQDYTLVGGPGEVVEYPADPVDAEGVKWFMGWYTTEEGTDEFTDTEFGYTNKTLYSLWKSDLPGLYQDFDEYKGNIRGKDVVISDWTPETVSGGFIKKTNREWFSWVLDRTNEVTYNDSAYSIKCDWKKDNTDTKESPSDINASSKYASNEMYMWLGSGLQNRTEYTLTFKYYLAKADTDVIFYATSAANHNVFGNVTQYGFQSETAGFVAPKSDAGQGWKEGKITFTTNFNGGTTMYLGFTLKANEDVLLYVDDVAINATIQPSESTVIVHQNNNEPDMVIKGKRGEKVNLPTLTHPDKAVLQRWCLDERLKVPATEADLVFGRKSFDVYADWGAVPLTFNNYTFPKVPEAFSRLMKIDESGIGIDNDNALRFDYKWDYVYKYVCSACSTKKNTQAEIDEHIATAHAGTSVQVTKALFNTRTSDKDHCFTVKRNLFDDTIYRVTYSYKVLNTNLANATVNVATARAENIWDTPHLNTYGAAATKMDFSSKDWQTNSFYFSTQFKSSVGKDLMLYITFSGVENGYLDLLIDNVIVEAIETPYIFFDGNNSKDSVLVRGNAGEKIKLPANPVKFGCKFKGWYTDPECTIPFTQATFEADTAITVYAGYTENDERTYTFENYDIDYYMDINKAKLQLVLAHNVTTKGAASGNKVIEIDRTTELTHESFFVIAEGKDVFKANPEYQYVIEFKYRIAETLPAPIVVGFSTAQETNIYSSRAKVSGSVKIDTDLKIGQWYTASVLIDASKAVQDNEYLFMHATGDDGKAQIDDIKITALKKGATGAFIMNNGCSQIPSFISGKPGTSFASKLPKAPTVPGKWFAGYYLMDANGGLTKLNDADMVISDKIMTVYANFLNTKVSQNFDDGIFKAAAEAKEAYSIHDFDFELYDSLKEGNSKDNVTSGRYSLHRKGETRYFESSVILNTGTTLSAEHSYTVTMKVKLGKHFHTDGAIKLHSNKSSMYAWAKTGDEHAIVAIKDLKEGEWVDVSYTFTSCEPYITLQTPGYVELFIDDIEFTIVTDESKTPNSSKIIYAEYQMLRRDENGNIIDFVESAFDVSSIVDTRLKIDKGISTTVIIVVAAAAGAVVLAGAVILIIVLAKKKKAKKQIKI